MKKFITIAVLFLFVGISQIQAQSTSSLVWKIGPKAGMNLSTLSNDLSVDPSFKMKFGFNVGAVANIRWGQRHLSSPVGTGYIGLQPEIQFSTQGAKSSGDDLKLNYIMIPVMVKFYITEKLNIEAGPEFAFLISHDPDKFILEEAEVDLENIKGAKDVLLGIGVGYELENGLSVGARYNLGFSGLADNLPWKNNVIQITLSWLFTL